MDASPIGIDQVETPLEYPGKRFSSRPTSDEFYTNFQNPGIMIIFNQYEFEDSIGSTREGTFKDLQRLKEVFGQNGAGYEIKDFTNLKAREIRQKLKEVADADHSQNTSLIVVILTHGGNDGQLKTFDAKIPTEDLWKPFTGDKCKSLSGKPKLFFIQACRGLKVDPGSLDTSNEAAFASKSKPSKEVKNPPFVIPTLSDILVFNSSADGYPSFRNEDGSWFIQTLCDKFDEYLKEGSEVELERVLKAVSRDVAYARQGFFEKCNIPEYKKYDASKQMPTIMTTLTKYLTFNKK